MSPVGADAGIEERLAGLAHQLDEVNAELRRQRLERAVLADLVEDLGPVGREMLESVVRQLAALDGRGYPAFAREGLGVVDRVVTSFGEEDVRALGDNIVLILETIKEMTQPEVMSMLRRSAALVTDSAEKPAAAPSLPRLLAQLRDADVRRGLGRVLTLLRSVGQEPAAAGTRTTGTEVLS